MDGERARRLSEGTGPAASGICLASQGAVAFNDPGALRLQLRGPLVKSSSVSDTKSEANPIPSAELSDAAAIKSIAVDAKMFTDEEVGFFDEMLAGFDDGSMEGHEWLVAENERGAVVAAANYAPEPFAHRVWNIYFIAVSPAAQGQGLGSSLVRHIEEDLRSRGEEIARVLVVETSSTDQYSRTRDFYRGLDYAEEARIRQFYGPDDDKIVFWKLLASTTAG